jgi:hypothetical protein
LGYTINGVAKQIASRYSVPENAMRDQLRAAVEAGKLILVSPETRMPYTNPPSVIRNFYDRIRSADIDKWFADNEAPYQLRQQQDEVVPLRPSSVPRKRIINGFPVSPKASDNRKFWDDKLSRPPQWLIGARVSVGKPGISSQWNPALVAHGLLGKGHMTLRALDAAMRNFVDWEEEWKDQTERDRQ